jgi:hypothetical protein
MSLEQPGSVYTPGGCRSDMGLKTILVLIRDLLKVKN